MSLTFIFNVRYVDLLSFANYRKVEKNFGIHTHADKGGYVVNADKGGYVVNADKGVVN